MYSQANQDTFVNNLLNIDNGYFLDIGAGTGGLIGYPIEFYSNTYFLEKNRGWYGIAIDYDKTWVDFAKSNRTCCCVCKNLLEVNINDILARHNCLNIVDYLSFDVDDAQEKVFEELDFNKYTFRVITFEHNAFQFMTSVQNHTKEHKDKVEKLYWRSRERLASCGYYLLHNDVTLDGYGPIEDWWVKPELIENFNEVYRNSTVGESCWNI